MRPWSTIRGPLAALAAAALVWTACGGSTDIGGGGGSDGGAGAASWAACDGPGQCVVMTTGCCAPCGKPTVGDVAGVRDGNQDAFRRSTCADPTPVCPECLTGTEPNLVALCRNDACAAIDLRQSDFSACSADSDCMLRDPACCEACAPNASGLVAIATARAGDYRQAVCKPDQSCPACAPVYPPSYYAACADSGHCEVRVNERLCPADQPMMGSGCDVAGQECEYGLDLRPGCRTHATCTGGAWQIAVSGCPPMPGPGAQGCPQSAPASGTCATEGLVCDMGGGAVCACGACVGGPCSIDPHWGCATPPATAGCPAVAPPLGSACSAPGAVCVYGVCGTSTSAGRRCEGGAWIDEPIPCPA